MSTRARTGQQTGVILRRVSTKPSGNQRDRHAVSLKGFDEQGQVAERSIATDCKSVAPVATKVRILPCPPPFAPRQAKGAHRSSRKRVKAGLELSVGASGGGPRGHTLLGGQDPPSRGRFEGREERRASGVARREGGSNSVVESQPSKLLVAGSIPVSRSRLRLSRCSSVGRARPW